MRCPFFWLSICLMAGVVSAYYLHGSLSLWLILNIIFLFSAWVCFFLSKKQISLILVGVATFTLGGGLSINFQHSFLSNPLFSLQKEGYLDFRGVVLQAPIKSTQLIYLLVETSTVAWGGDTKRMQGRLKISLPLSSHTKRIESFLPGDRVAFSARLLPRESWSNFNSNNQAFFSLQRQKIHRRAFTKSGYLIMREHSGSSHQLIRYFSSLRIKARHFIEKKFSHSTNKTLTPEGAILTALLLGERAQLSPESSQEFQAAGLFHLFAISGAHIAVISYLFFSLFNLLGLKKRNSLILLLFCLFFFSLFLPHRTSVFRAILMSILYILGKIIWKDINLLNTLGISAFFLIFIWPFQPFDIGFQLTFGATLAIILLFPLFQKPLPHFPWRISELMAVTTAAQIGTMPLLAFHFHRLTLLGFFLNLPAIPLLGLIMGLGYLLLVSSTIFPPICLLGLPLLKALTFIFLLLPRVVRIIPFLSWRCPSPSEVIILGYYLSLAGIIVFHQKIVRWSLVVVFSMATLLLMTSPRSSSFPGLRVTFLDVGQGQSILVEFPQEKKMLIDGGGLVGSQFDIGEKIVSPFLWSKGIKSIDYLVLTHAHPDHLLGLLSVAQNFRIKNFWYASLSPENLLFQQLNQTLSSEVKKRQLLAGEELTIGEVSLQVLSPDQNQINKNPKAENQNSLVLRLSYRSFAFLFPADITSDIEKKLIREGHLLQADILQVPHHGSLTSSSAEFISQVNPVVAIASTGGYQAFQLPHPQVKERYIQKNVHFLDTHQTGAIEISIEKDSLSIQTARTREKYKVFSSGFSFFQIQRKFPDNKSLLPDLTLE